jgi:hypothetical protein
MMARSRPSHARAVSVAGESRVPEDERVDIDNGNIWIESMNRTLERLDGLCTSQLAAPATPD